MSKHFSVRHLKVPDDLFRQIELLTEADPNKLSMHHWHERADGREAVLPMDVLAPSCKHCLFGWVTRLVPGAIEWAWEMHPDVDVVELGNALLVASGRYPIPPALAFSDEKSAMKVIRGRAAEEREMAEADAEDEYECERATA